MQAVRSQVENINGPFIYEGMLGLTSRRIQIKNYGETDAIFNLSDWQKYKSLTTNSVASCGWKPILSYVADGNVEWKGKLVISIKIPNAFVPCPNNPNIAPAVSLEHIQNSVVKVIYCGIVCNSKILEITHTHPSLQWNFM